MGLIVKPGTCNGTQIQYLRDSGPGPNRNLKNPGSGTGTGTRANIRDCVFSNRKSGTGTQNAKIKDPGLGPGPRFVERGILGLNYSGLFWGPKKSGTRSRRLKTLVSRRKSWDAYPSPSVIWTFTEFLYIMSASAFGRNEKNINYLQNIS